MKKQRIVIRAAQVALHGVSREAERIDEHLKAVFAEVGLPAPQRTRGQEFARTMRRYAARLGAALERGKP